ncbi:magnesium transporter MRS2-11, chloroplastic-like isoform X2 [Zingiber officinale]|uniref:magnesium transporter MRS2-11, chloroplastic-like isoform X2 n=1 Tax=Zingiber officinale TaxID=94328 RepID=UPI001C4D13B5|nr:magnesium transporter MRS2-11, chloroplastic-like isoform X2 [Zingiber officinale]
MSSSSLLLFLDLSRFFHQADRASLLPFRAFSASVSSTSLSTYPTRSLLSIHPVLSVSRSTVRPLSEKGGGDGGGAVVRSQQENTEGELAEAEKEFVADGVCISGTSESEPSFQQQEKRRRMVASADSISLGIREPVYEVIEVKSDGTVSTRKINRRQLLKSSGLRPRDIRSVDPSLWLMNSMPSLLVREQAILMNLGSLRAIVMNERVLIFDYNRKGGRAFLKTLLPRLNSKSNGGGLAMPFELEVVEAALLSRINRLEHRIMNIEPRVVALLEVLLLPNRLTADVLEDLRLSKQTLVELGSRAGELKQMLLDLLEDPHEIRRICIMGRNCTIRRGSNDVECSLLLDKQIAEEEEEEIEMLLENYLQRCESCHGQAERLLDSAKEMEDSIAVNLSVMKKKYISILLDYFCCISEHICIPNCWLVMDLPILFVVPSI